MTRKFRYAIIITEIKLNSLNLDKEFERDKNMNFKRGFTKFLTGAILLGGGERLANEIKKPETRADKKEQEKVDENFIKKNKLERQKQKEKIEEGMKERMAPDTTQAEKQPLTEDQYYKSWEKKLADFSNAELINICAHPDVGTEWIMEDYDKNNFGHKNWFLKFLSDKAFEILKEKSKTEPKAVTDAINAYLKIDSGQDINRANGPFGKKLEVLKKIMRIEGDVRELGDLQNEKEEKLAGPLSSL